MTSWSTTAYRARDNLDQNPGSRFGARFRNDNNINIQISTVDFARIEKNPYTFSQHSYLAKFTVRSAATTAVVLQPRLDRPKPIRLKVFVGRRRVHSRPDNIILIY